MSSSKLQSLSHQGGSVQSKLVVVGLCDLSMLHVDSSNFMNSTACQTPFKESKKQLPRPIKFNLPSGLDTHSQSSLWDPIQLDHRAAVMERQTYQHISIYTTELPPTPKNLEYHQTQALTREIQHPRAYRAYNSHGSKESTLRAAQSAFLRVVRKYSSMMNIYSQPSRKN